MCRIKRFFVIVLLACLSLSAVVADTPTKIIEDTDLVGIGQEMLQNLANELQQRGYLQNLPTGYENSTDGQKAVILRSIAAQYTFDYYKNKWENDLAGKSTSLNRPINSDAPGGTDSLTATQCKWLDFGQYDECSRKVCNTKDGRVVQSNSDLARQSKGYRKCITETCKVPLNMPSYKFCWYGINNPYRIKSIYEDSSGIHDRARIDYSEEEQSAGYIVNRITLERMGNLNSIHSGSGSYVSYRLDFFRETVDDLDSLRQYRLDYTNNTMRSAESPEFHIIHGGIDEKATECKASEVCY